MLADEGLVLRLLAPEAIEVNAAEVQLDLAADQPVWPERIEREGVPQESHGAGIVRASEEDEPA